MTGGFLPAATTRNYTLSGVCGVPANAQAISLNAAVTNPTGPGFLVLWPKGGALPPVSTLNYVAGETIANAAVVPLSSDGSVSMALGVSGADVILDTNGYYAPQPTVTTLNTFSGDLTVAAGSNVTVTPSGGNTLTISAAGPPAPPTGPAGGALTGTYPNPGIASGQVVTSLNGLKDSVTLQAGANTSVLPSGNTITVSSLGTITGVTAGTGLTGGGLSGTVSVSIPPGGITGDRIAAGQVVKSVNGAQDAVSIVGNGVTVSTVGNTVTLSILQGAMMYGPPGDTNLINAGFTETRAGAVDFWTPTSSVNAPTPRSGHTAVWTGSKMIVWGGVGRTATQNGVATNTGGIYNPTTDTWTSMSTTNAPTARQLHSAVWTGSKMIVWGGADPLACCPPTTQTGGIYDPATDSWAALGTSTSGAPSGRTGHTAVWSGSRMIVWGGNSSTCAPCADGAQYDPALDSWTPTTTTGGPPARTLHTAVWTGTRMIVWGGTSGSNPGDGAVYFPGTTPGTDSWTLTSLVNAPSQRLGHTALWTGTQMLIWGGLTYDSSGGLYDPLANSWVPTNLGNAPPTTAQAYGPAVSVAVWTGTRALFWGASSDFSTLVYQYNPNSDAWSFPTSTGAPVWRTGATAVWTGSRLIVWGGQGAGANPQPYLSSGGQWMPLSLYVKN